MKKLFKFSLPFGASVSAAEAVRKVWDEATKDTDLEGSKLLILLDGTTIEPLSEKVVLREAADILEKYGKHVYAKELKSIAGN